MTENKELYTKILELSHKNQKAEIGALFREFEHIKNPEAMDILKKVYTQNKFSSEEFKEDAPPLEVEAAKTNGAYIRRCSLLALMDCIQHIPASSNVNSAKIFLLSCIDDSDHSVREVILGTAPQIFDSQQLVAWYSKIRNMEKENANTGLSKDDYAAVRRGLIFVIGEKLNMIEDRDSVVDFIHSILSVSRDTDSFVCSAAAEILGKYGNDSHIKTLEDIVNEHEYPAHLRAAKAIEEIKIRKITEPVATAEEDTSTKDVLYTKINGLQEAIRILQTELEKYTKQLQGKD